MSCLFCAGPERNCHGLCIHYIKEEGHKKICHHSFEDGCYGLPMGCENCKEIKMSIIDDYDAIGKRLQDISPRWLPTVERKYLGLAKVSILNADILWRISVAPSNPMRFGLYDWACASQRALDLFQRITVIWSDKKLFDWWLKWSIGNSRDNSAFKNEIPEDFIFLEYKEP